jgi:hypothetical protein
VKHWVEIFFFFFKSIHISLKLLFNCQYSFQTTNCTSMSPLKLQKNVNVLSNDKNTLHKIIKIKQKKTKTKIYTKIKNWVYFF